MIAIEALIGAMKADALARYEESRDFTVTDQRFAAERRITYAIDPSMTALGEALSAIRDATVVIEKLNRRIHMLERLNADAVVAHDAAMDGTDPDPIDYGFAPVKHRYMGPDVTKEERQWRAMMLRRAAKDGGCGRILYTIDEPDPNHTDPKKDPDPS